MSACKGRAGIVVEISVEIAEFCGNGWKSRKRIIICTSDGGRAAIYGRESGMSIIWLQPLSQAAA
jgi:hypothetical protein